MELKTLTTLSVAMIAMFAAIAPSNARIAMGTNRDWSKRVRTGAPTQSAKGIQLTLRTLKESYRSDEEVLLWLRVRNSTRRSLFLVETYSEREYKFDVKNENGEGMRLTEEGERLLNNNAIYRSGPLMIEPGGEKQHSVSINRIYEMTTPSMYTVTVRRKIFKLNGQQFAEAVSNALKIRILE